MHDLTLSRIGRLYVSVSCSTVAFIVVNLTHAQDASPVFPGAEWLQRSPADVGLDAGKLSEFSDFVGGRGCVVRHGAMIYTWGDATRRGDVASACKPWYSHFLFVALEQGRIPSLEEKAIRWEPRLGEINAALEHKDRDITWRHFANQTSCYGLPERPGSAYAYNDWQMALFWDTLFGRVFKTEFANVDERVLHPLLTDVLQCQDDPTFMAFGLDDRPGRLGVSPRDFARFGLLYLRGGHWRGRQLITPEHARIAVQSPLSNDIPRAGMVAAEMIPEQRTVGSKRIPDNQTDHYGSYSWLWWTNGVDREGRRHWPDAPLDAFGAFGHGGPRAMVVLPELDLIVSWNDARVRGREMENEALKRLVAAVATRSTVAANQPLGSIGRFAKWAPIEIDIAGPDSQGRGDPNPFAMRVDVDMVSPSGKTHAIPGFYDGNGRGGLDGNVWSVRFSADEIGEWRFVSRSANAQLDGHSGTFTVTPPPTDGPEFYRWGRLESVATPENGIRYLKFRDGPYWLKAGCDDPENFLGTFEHYDTPAERKAAVDFLAARGVNSMYIMTHTLGGDHDDVWPWLGDTVERAKAHATGDARFDVARLHEWRELFTYMTEKGVVPYLILEDDSAWSGYDHARYIRELIARFGDLPALLFNLGEESNENYSLDEGLRRLETLARIDPYDHPRGIHNVNTPNDAYIDHPDVDFTAIQTGSPTGRPPDPLQHHARTLEWINRCRERGRRTLVVNFDEGRPEQDRRAWWSAYLGGGVWEVHVREPYDRPMSAWEPAWSQLGGTRAVMETLPFWDMQPHQGIVRSGRAFCLAQPGQVYALYLPEGGTVTLDLPERNEYEFAWWNPANDRNGTFQNTDRVPGGRQSFTAPDAGDWALRVRIHVP